MKIRKGNNNEITLNLERGSELTLIHFLEDIEAIKVEKIESAKYKLKKI